MRKLLIIFTLFSNIGYGQISLTIDGKTLNDSIALSNISIAENIQDSSLLIPYLNELIVNVYEQGFITAEFDSTNTDTAIAYARLNAGEQYEWVSLKPGNLSPLIIDEIGFKNSFDAQVFNQSELNSLFETLIRYYENNGYPFVTVKLDSIKIEDQSISASINLSKNNYITIDSIIVKGYDKIPDNFIKYNLLLKPGIPYNEEIIQSVPLNINQIDFAASARDPQVLFTKEKTSVYLYLKEIKANRFDGVVGLQSNEDGSVSINGDLYLKLLNLFKTGESLIINWKRPDDQIQTLDLDLQFPFIFKSPLWLDLQLNLFRQDTTFLNLGFTGGFQYMIRPRNFVSLHIEQKSSSILLQNKDNAVGVNEFTSSIFRIGLQSSRLDNNIGPRKGYKLKTSLGSGTRKTSDQSQSQQLYTFDVEFYIPIKKRSVIATRLQSAGIFSDNLFDNELYRIGGLRTLRGFNEQSIFSSFYTIATLEYRFLMTRQSYLFGFTDAAYTENDVTSNTNDFLLGTGLGLTFNTRSGIFTLSYALGKQENQPFDFQTSKLHFGYVNQF